MSSEASPRPWRLDDGFACEIVDATGRHVFTATSKYAIPPRGDEREAANAALVIEAVNGYAALLAERDALRRLVGKLAQGIQFARRADPKPGGEDPLLREAAAVCKKAREEK